MRNKTVRMKRLRAQRIVADFMRMPQRLIVGLPDYRETNLKAIQENRLWVIPEPDAKEGRLWK